MACGIACDGDRFDDDEATRDAVLATALLSKLICLLCQIKRSDASDDYCRVN